MANAANLAELTKRSQHGQNGAVMPVFIYGTFNVTSAGYTAVTDINGDAIVLDFDGLAVAIFNLGATSGGPAGTLTLKIGDTVVALGGENVSVDTLEFLDIYYSERAFVAGSALTATSSNNDKTGHILLVCIPT